MGYALQIRSGFDTFGHLASQLRSLLGLVLLILGRRNRLLESLEDFHVAKDDVEALASEGEPHHFKQREVLDESLRYSELESISWEDSDHVADHQLRQVGRLHGEAHLQGDQVLVGHLLQLLRFAPQPPCDGLFVAWLRLDDLAVLAATHFYFCFIAIKSTF